MKPDVGNEPAATTHLAAPDRRRVLAPRTSEEEALFIARKYLENKSILEAKLANAVNGGRFLRQNMLDVVAADLSAKFNVANRSRKYVEQKLRDMKKEARKYLNMAKTTKVMENGEIVRTIPRNPPEPIRVMMEAMADDHLNFSGADTTWSEMDFSDTVSCPTDHADHSWNGHLFKACKAEGSDDDDCIKSPAGVNTESVASTSSSSSIDFSAVPPVFGIDTLLGAYFGQPMLAAAMAGLSMPPQPLPTTPVRPTPAPVNSQSTSSTTSSTTTTEHTSAPSPTPSKARLTAASPHRMVYPGRCRRRRMFKRSSRLMESRYLATESFRRLCDSLIESVPRAAKSFEEACKLQREYFRMQISLTSFATQMQAASGGFHNLS